MIAPIERGFLSRFMATCETEADKIQKAYKSTFP